MYKEFENLLKKNQISAYKVSKETGIPQSTFTDWKNSRSKPKIEKLIRLAEFFKIDIDVFIKDRITTEK